MSADKGTHWRKVDAATSLGQALEAIVYQRAATGNLLYVGTNDDLLMSYWSLVFEYNKGILCLVRYEYYSSAAALLRPLVEAVVRAYVVKIGRAEDISKIRKGRYNVSYEKDGDRIDKAFGLKSLFGNFLKKVRNILHSFTHSGNAQLSRRWDGNALAVNFSESDIFSLIALPSLAAFLITLLVADHYNLEHGRTTAESVYQNYLKTSTDQPPS